MDKVVKYSSCKVIFLNYLIRKWENIHILFTHNVGEVGYVRFVLFCFVFSFRFSSWLSFKEVT